MPGSFFIFSIYVKRDLENLDRIVPDLADAALTGRFRYAMSIFFPCLSCAAFSEKSSRVTLR